MTEQEEKKNEKVSMLMSLGIHGLILIAFLFILAWRAPDPPLPEYGIELNFGLSDAGSGEVQPQTPANTNTSNEDAAPEEVPEEAAEPVEQTSEPAEPAAESVEAVDNTQDSPDVVPDTRPEEPRPVVEEEKKEEQKKPETKPQEVKPAEKPADGARGNDGESREAAAANQGDRRDATGDQGNPEGSLDSRALYGNPGGGGSSLDMAGWMWDFEPKPKDTSSETGRIVFEIKVDDQGEILSVRRLESTVSPAVEKTYRQEVERLTFSKTSSNAIVAPISTGKITFVIKSK